MATNPGDQRVNLPDGRFYVVKGGAANPAAAAKAVRLMLAKQEMIAGQRVKTPSTGDSTGANFGNQMFLGFPAMAAGGVSAATTALKNAQMRRQGQTPLFSPQDAYEARRQIISGNQDRFNIAHPALSAGSGLLGSLATPGLGEAAGLMKGGALTAKLLPEAVTGLAGAGKGLLSGLEGAAKRAAFAGAVGGASGLANAAPGDEASGAAQGAEGGAALGLALGGAGKLAAPALARTGQVVARAVNKATGGTMLSPASEASKLLSKTLLADGATPDQMKTMLNTWLKTGGDAPSLLDLARKLPSGGGNTLKLLTGAAMKGGSGAAQEYADTTAGAMTGRVKKYAQALLPENSPNATDLAASLKAKQGSIADEMYPGPYATQIPVTPGIGSALSDQPGVNAVQAAITEAIDRRDYGSAARLKALIAPAAEPPTGRIGDVQVPLPQHILDQIQTQLPQAASDAGLTAGDLHRVQINMGQAGEGAMTAATPRRGSAAGLFQRTADLKNELEQVPELGQANATYRGIQGQRDALDLGQTAIGAQPDEYQKAMQDFFAQQTPEDNPYPVSKEAIQVAGRTGHMQAIKDLVGGAKSGTQGALNTLANTEDVGANQNFDFGPAAAGGFRGAVKNEVSRMRNAQLIDPTFSSRSAGRIDALMDPNFKAPKFGLGTTLLSLANKVADGATLTDPEREAIVRMGTSLADPAFTHLDPQEVPALQALMQHVAGSAPAATANLYGSAIQP